MKEGRHEKCLQFHLCEIQKQIKQVNLEFTYLPIPTGILTRKWQVRIFWSSGESFMILGGG